MLGKIVVNWLSKTSNHPHMFGMIFTIRTVSNWISLIRANWIQEEESELDRVSGVADSLTNKDALFPYTHALLYYWSSLLAVS